jgi:hypothetical protein
MRSNIIGSIIAASRASPVVAIAAVAIWTSAGVAELGNGLWQHVMTVCIVSASVLWMMGFFASSGQSRGSDSVGTVCARAGLLLLLGVSYFQIVSHPLRSVMAGWAAKGSEGLRTSEVIGAVVDHGETFVMACVCAAVASLILSTVTGRIGTKPSAA